MARPASSSFAFIGGVLGGSGIPFLALSLAAEADDVRKAVATLMLIVAALGLSVSIVATRRHEPRSTAAVVLSVLGLLAVIVYAAAVGFS